MWCRSKWKGYLGICMHLWSSGWAEAQTFLSAVVKNSRWPSLCKIQLTHKSNLFLVCRHVRSPKPASYSVQHSDKVWRSLRDQTNAVWFSGSGGLWVADTEGLVDLASDDTSVINSSCSWRNSCYWIFYLTVCWYFSRMSSSSHLNYRNQTQMNVDCQCCYLTFSLSIHFP